MVANVLVTHLTAALDKIAPKKKIQPRNSYVPHLTSSTKQMMRDRDTAKQVWIESSSDSDWKEFKKARNQALKAQRKDKKKWAVEMVTNNGNEGNNTKKLWSTVKKSGGNEQILC